MTIPVETEDTDRIICELRQLLVRDGEARRRDLRRTAPLVLLPRRPAPMREDA